MLPPLSPVGRHDPLPDQFVYGVSDRVAKHRFALYHGIDDRCAITKINNNLNKSRWRSIASL